MKQSNPQSLTPEQHKTAIVGEYLYKYAAIANRIVDAELISIFVEGLEGLSVREIERGMDAYLKEGNRFPWPSDIRELGEL